MKATKILAGLFFALAVIFALFAWKINSDTSKRSDAVPVPAASSTSGAAETAQANTAAKPYEAVVVAEPIRAGQRIDASQVKLVAMDKEVAGGFRQVNDVIGRTTLVSLGQDHPVLEQSLLSGLSLQLEPGQRAVAIAVREAMAAGHHLVPGDFVDVFFTLDADNEREAELASQARLLLARTRILAYGPSTVEDALRSQPDDRQDASKNASPSRNLQRGDAPRTANTAVLAVAVDDVERLTLAERFGQLSLALRHPDDTALPDEALFANLPAALRPLATSSASAVRLSPEDRAYAGTRWKDLVRGGVVKPSAPVVQQAAPRSPPRTATKAMTSSSSSAATKDSVELYQGNVVQTVQY